jgi:hypothetical protein
MKLKFIVLALVMLLVFSPVLINTAFSIVIPAIGTALHNVFTSLNPSILIGGGGDEMDPEVFPG